MKNKNSMKGFTLLFVFLLLFSIPRISTTRDTITLSESIRDGETVISAGGSFELGFFSPGNSSSRYLGIWYKKIDPNRTVVWVANRETPLSDSSGVLNITDEGILVLISSRNDIVWSSNTSRIIRQNPVGQLLESGNLVVKDGTDNNNPEDFLWQSFDFPSDTLLPGMKLGKNLVTGFDTFLSSWKSTDNPASGDFTYQVDLDGVPQYFLKKGSIIQYRVGSWNGLRLMGAAGIKPNAIYTYESVWNANEIYYKFELRNNSVASRLVLDPAGIFRRLTWIDQSQNWVSYHALDQCDNYGLCGAYASCNIDNIPVCTCLKGFEPISSSQWSLSYWSDGCARKTNLSCDDQGDGFLKFTEVKLPDTSGSWFSESIGLKECGEICSKNCSCVAYATLDVTLGIGCLLWFNDLIDIRQVSENGQDLYVRVAASELGNTQTKWEIVLISVFSIVLVTGVPLLGWILYMRKNKIRKKRNMRNSHEKDYNDEGGKEEMELPIFDMMTIVNATDHFSEINKLGQGGFGPVYKGKLADGKEIAVKRLSKDSGQGLTEFKNEVSLISKLQHRNLVKLLGFCVEGDERMLIYECMPNKSLDYFIFDQTRAKLLGWHKRKTIIGGIARGLVYLHQDSRLRIIHRDLKTSNILLDKDMIPKISDFGIARTFGGDQIIASTNRIVGTYGYMSPEYAGYGHFSVKSDVFSFGVLVLEIVSGKKNRGFYHPNHNDNLLGHAWRLWIEGKPLELVDKLFGDSCSSSEVSRCIQVGLLCVQQRPEDRPNMSSVVLMLGSDNSLLQPKQPGFFTETNLCEAGFSPCNHGPSSPPSTNGITISMLEPR